MGKTFYIAYNDGITITLQQVISNTTKKTWILFLNSIKNADQKRWLVEGGIISNFDLHINRENTQFIDSFQGLEVERFSPIGSKKINIEFPVSEQSAINQEYSPVWL